MDEEGPTCETCRLGQDGRGPGPVSGFLALIYSSKAQRCLLDRLSWLHPLEAFPRKASWLGRGRGDIRVS